MKNKTLVCTLSFAAIFLGACAQGSDPQADKKAQPLLKKYMPKSKEAGLEDYKIGSRPDFSAIKDTKEKKQAFVNFMLPMIRESNRLILKERETLIVALAKTEDNAEPLKDSGLLKLCNRYTKNCQKASRKDTLTSLLERINVVPASLVLAQSANESAWGTSRFSVKANNFFGQWCFTKGCGLVPKKRGATQTHEVRKFSSPLASVKGYMLNINTGGAYTDLRKIRAKLQLSGKPISGIALAGGLMKYSERGQAYIDEVRHMITYNKFSDYDVY